MPISAMSPESARRCDGAGGVSVDVAVVVGGFSRIEDDRSRAMSDAIGDDTC